MDEGQDAPPPRRRLGGGRQPGAGRPPGPGRLALEAIDAARQEGLLPHEILLDMARGNPQKVLEVVYDEQGLQVARTSKWVSLTVEDQRDAAKAAAPYYAPKLSAVETVGGMGDAELDALIRQFAAQAGVASLAGGEGQAGEEAVGAGAGDGGAGRVARRRLS